MTYQSEIDDAARMLAAAGSLTSSDAADIAASAVTQFGLGSEVAR